MNGIRHCRAIPVLLAIAVTVIGSGLLALRITTGSAAEEVAEGSPSAAAAPQTAPQVRSNPSGASHDSSATPRIRTGTVDLMGQPVTVSCASCHANFDPDFEVTSGEQLTEFHQGLQFDHGSLSCLTCHHPENYNLLRLADGRAVDFADTQLLCSQCHAREARDYQHGAHGGLSGYWDATRGPQRRKQCIDCHDPHAPEFPAMVPTFKPHDRFLAAPDREEADE